MTVRLNKLLAERGLGARRKCDELIARGDVRVNGEVVTTLGVRVDPQRDRILVEGRPLPPAARMRYLLLHKPVGVITTLSDPEGRATVAQFMPPGTRLFPVGRLDAGTSGLLLLTNDGELAHHLMHPRYGVEKFYRVLVTRRPDPSQVARLQRGVALEGGLRSAPARVRLREPIARGHVIEIAVHEGRYHQVRRMCEAVGLEVVALHRWGYGPLRLGELARGMWRELSDEEVRRLRASAARPAGRVPPDRPERRERRGPRPLAGGTGFAALRRDRPAARSESGRRPVRPPAPDARPPMGRRERAPEARMPRAQRPPDRRGAPRAEVGAREARRWRREGEPRRGAPARERGAVGSGRAPGPRPRRGPAADRRGAPTPAPGAGRRAERRAGPWERPRGGPGEERRPTRGEGRRSAPGGPRTRPPARKPWERWPRPDEEVAPRGGRPRTGEKPRGSGDIAAGRGPTGHPGLERRAPEERRGRRGGRGPRR